MKLSVIVFESNGNFEDEKIVNIINKFNLNIEFIFVEHNINCENNLEFYRSKNFSNLWILKYKNYDEINIRNFSINFVFSEYVMFLNYKNIDLIENLEKNICFLYDFDVCVLNFSLSCDCKLDYVNFIFRVKFLCENNLWFYDISSSFDYFQVIKSIYYGKNIFFTNLNDETFLKEIKNKKIIFDFLFKCIMTNMKNVCELSGVEGIYKFIIYLFDVIDFLNVNFMYEEIESLIEIYNSHNLNIRIDESILCNLEKFRCKTTNNLFLVHTPYHILLATCLSLSRNYINCENSIFINDTFGCDDDLIRKLKPIFRNIYIGKDSENKNYIDTLISIQSLLKGRVYDNIFVNNESELKTQFIINHNLKCDGKLIYVEDGTANYGNVKNKSGYMDQMIVKYFSNLLAMNIENIKFLGGHSRIDERHFLYPELIMDELKETVKNISIDCNFLKDSIKLIYGNCDLNNENFVMIALEHSSFTSMYEEYDMNLYSNLIEELVVSIKNLGKKVYLKYHPRENNEYLKLNCKDNNICILNKNSAIESFFCRNMMLISLHSTSLITFSKLFTNQNAICIQNLVSNYENELTKLFKNIGIFFPNTVDEIILKISG